MCNPLPLLFVTVASIHSGKSTIKTKYSPTLFYLFPMCSDLNTRWVKTQKRQKIQNEKQKWAGTLNGLQYYNPPYITIILYWIQFQNHSNVALNVFASDKCICIILEMFGRKTCARKQHRTKWNTDNIEHKPKLGKSVYELCSMWTDVYIFDSCFHRIKYVRTFNRS